MFFVQVLILLLPILAANQAGYAGRWNWPLGNHPTSARWLGTHKTIGAFYAGPLFACLAMLVIYPYEIVRNTFGLGSLVDAVQCGVLIGFCTVLADQMNAFIKRRIGYAPGHPFPLDRVDWVLGGGLAALWSAPEITWLHVLALIVIAIPIHVYGNRHSYRRGWRNAPH